VSLAFSAPIIRSCPFLDAVFALDCKSWHSCQQCWTLAKNQRARTKMEGFLAAENTEPSKGSARRRLRFKPEGETILMSRGDDMPFCCGSRVDHKGQRKLPRCHSLIPYTDVVRSGAIPPVPRDRFWSLSTNSSLRTHFTPNLGKTPESGTVYLPSLGKLLVGEKRLAMTLHLRLRFLSTVQVEQAGQQVPGFRSGFRSGLRSARAWPCSATWLPGGSRCPTGAVAPRAPGRPPLEGSARRAQASQLDVREPDRAGGGWAMLEKIQGPLVAEESASMELADIRKWAWSAAAPWALGSPSISHCGVIPLG
jgi:hypothetical protein